MYFKFNTIEEVNAHLFELLSDYRARLEAWQAVKVNKKKSGEEFAQLSRAIEGAKIGAYNPVEDFAHPYISVFYKVGARYCRDELPAYFYIDELPKGTERETVYNGGIIRSTTPKTAEEVRAAIAEYIEQIKTTIKEYEKQLANAEKAFTAYRAAIAEAEKTLAEACNACNISKHIGNNSLYYAITGTR